MIQRVSGYLKHQPWLLGSVIIVGLSKNYYTKYLFLYINTLLGDYPFLVAVNLGGVPIYECAVGVLGSEIARAFKTVSKSKISILVAVSRLEAWFQVHLQLWNVAAKSFRQTSSASNSVT